MCLKKGLILFKYLYNVLDNKVNYECHCIYII